MKCVIEEKKNCFRMRGNELTKVIFDIFIEVFSEQDLQSKMVQYLVKSKLARIYNQAFAAQFEAVAQYLRIGLTKTPNTFLPVQSV